MHCLHYSRRRRGIINEKAKIIVGVLAFLLLLSAAVFGYNTLRDMGHSPDSAIAQERERLRAPDFTVLDIYSNEIQFYDFLGKPIVLNFWTTWCPNCVAEMPHFERLYNEMGDEVHFVKVNLLDGERETRGRVNTFMAEHGYTFPIFFDTTGEASGLYGVRTIPLTVFIDAEGYLVAITQGQIREQELRQGIEMAMGSSE